MSCAARVWGQEGEQRVVRVPLEQPDSRLHTASARAARLYLFYILRFHMFAKGNWAAESILKTPGQHDFKTSFQLTEGMCLVFLTSL